MTEISSGLELELFTRADTSSRNDKARVDRERRRNGEKARSSHDSNTFAYEDNYHLLPHKDFYLESL